ncbi:MAG: hypothetical protein V5A32_00020 [Halovenus sp.]
MSENNRLRRLVSDRRARIPFALIGILLLVSAGVLVLQIDTQEQSMESLDRDSAMERTDAAVQTATRDAVSQASERATQQPLTETADTEFGEVLDTYGGRLTEDDDPFPAYLRAMIYLEAQETLETAGQDVGGVETEVSLPRITDAESLGEAIDRVELTPRGSNPDLETGLVRVTLSDVTTVLRTDGEVIDSQTETVTVTVPTPVIQLHERTERFQDRLEAGVTDPGFSQRFNAGIYTLGWIRGYAQYNGMPVTEVIADRHIVPTANTAIYETQQDVFGTTDPQLDNALQKGWLCTFMQDTQGIYNSDNRSITRDYAEDLCDASGWLFGDQATGELPNGSNPTDFIGQPPGIDATEKLGVNETAYLPLRELASPGGEHSVESVLDRIFEIEAEMETILTDVSPPEFTHDPPSRYGSGDGRRLSRTNEGTRVHVTNISEGSSPEHYYTISGDARIRVEEVREHTDYGEGERHFTTTSDTGTLSAEFEIHVTESETAPAANIDAYQQTSGGTVEIEPEHKYEPGPGKGERGEQTVPGGTGPEGFENYDGAENQILRAFAGGTSRSQLSDWLETRWADAISDGDLRAHETRNVGINQSSVSESHITAVVSRDITTIQEDISDIIIEYERTDLVHDSKGTGPYGKLLEAVRAEKESYLTQDQPYENVGEKIVYETRYAYFESLESDLEDLESANNEALGALDGELDGLGLDTVASYLQQGVTATPPESVPLESSSLTGNISYEISGSPTYLVAENVTTHEVPAVKNDIDAFAPLATRNRNYLKLPYESVAKGVLDRIGAVIGLGDTDAKLTLRMAGEALQAGELAETAAQTETTQSYADDERLQEKTETLESGVDSALDQFQTDVTDQILIHLYPDDIRLPCTGGCRRSTTAHIEGEFGDGVACSHGTCTYEIDPVEVCESLSCEIRKDSTAERSRPQIDAATRQALENYGTDRAGTAVAIGEGNITEPLVTAVFESVDDTEYRPEYTRSVPDEQWRAHVSSAVRPAVTQATNSAAVRIGDTGTVENLDEEIREALESVSGDIVEERLEDRLSGKAFDIDRYDDWVNGIDTPVRVPAGMPVLPLPSHWVATANVWDIQVDGEYARFEVTANMGSPETGGKTTYVREQQTVTREIGDESRTLGTVEPIDFSGRSALVVVVPPGGIGVGDRDDDGPDCSPTWPVTGVVSEGEIECG